MSYHTVFEAGTKSPFYSVEGVMFAVLLATGIGLCFTALFYWRRTHTFEQFLFGVALAGFVSLGFSAFLLLMVLSEGVQARYLSSLLAAGEYSQVSGPVHDFRPEIESADQPRRSGSFAVLDKRFYYSQYVVNGGFNQTVGMGSPIRDGLQVRIFYRDGLILKLQVGDRMRTTNQAGAN